MDIAAILSKKYNAEWILNGDDYDGLIWLSDDSKPTKKELEDLWPVVEAELKSEKVNKVNAKLALLDKLGITADEARLLLS